MQMTSTNCSRTDRMLLKGFYTNNRDELENPSLLKGNKAGGETPFNPDKSN